ncbi:unnamed protein product [Mycena citricolor]|uniref:GH16 domain-containing protein n=1 Tax=Mycena citricolor TaxID=2018698 RepID=A0AAD2Q2R5_9AGAR|nr:unnamed protein product [Mycena citricolor]
MAPAVFSPRFIALVALSNVAAVLAGTYQRADLFVGANFYDSFDFQAIPDPTHGRVNYVDQATAQAQNLTFAGPNKFVLRADHTTVISDASPVGRNSVRIQSKKKYSTHAAVFDIAHMPEGCGTWPAIWETDTVVWPHGGELDIIEGVNGVGSNQMTLHTDPGCTMPQNRAQTGTSLQLNCDANVNGNAGCGVSAGQPLSYGPAFNANGGGWYAIERSPNGINVWFWARSDPTVPQEVRVGGVGINTQGWGTPTASFPNTQCNIGQFFDAHNIIINLTLCGDWAGQPQIYASAGCPSSCMSFVDANPAAFANAYFEINSINVYT